MEKKNVILLTVVAVATLLITVVGATFAYFAATIDNSQNEEITITAANDLTITYNDGTTIEGENILPGWGETYDKDKSYTMTVVNNSETADITYDMKWNEVVNEITDKANLVFSADASMGWDAEAALEATENNTAVVDPVAEANKQFPAGSSTDAFVTGQTLKPGEKITYTIKVAYKYSEEKQDSLDKSFSGKIIIDKETIRSKTHVPDPKD